MEKTPQPRRISSLDVRIAKSLDRDEALIATARRSEYASALATREITASVIDSFAQKVAGCRTKVAQFETQFASQKSVTQTEASARRVVLDALEELQSAASQKYAEDPVQKPRLAAYSVGKGIRRMPQSDLGQAAETALRALATDTLPGITAAKKTAFADALAAWRAQDITQNATVADKQKARQELDTLLESVAKEHRTILRAVDAQWPYHKAENRPIRAEFGLPKTRPMK